MTSNNAQLFCQQCGEYCCSLHDEHSLTQTPGRSAVPPPPPPRPNAAPCGPKCYRAASDPSSLVVIVLDSDSEEDRRKAVSAAVPWTREEAFLFPRLQRVLGPNWCSIAVALGTKSCAEVR